MSDEPTAIIGFGELGRTWALGLRHAGVSQVRVFARRPSDVDRAAALAEAIRKSGAARCATPHEAVRGAAWVIAAVPARAVLEVAAQVASDELDGIFYVDVASAAPHIKLDASRLIERAGGRYIDAAVMGNVVTAGLTVPVYASGAEAGHWAGFVAPLGMDVTVVAGPPGLAAQLKLIRSVYMKGRDALVVEMLLAARRSGLTQQVLASIRGPGEEVAFDVLAERLACGLVAHAQRRAEELKTAADLLNRVGVAPTATQGALERLDWVVQRCVAVDAGQPKPRDLLTALEALDPFAVEARNTSISIT
jgi:3-hydroxyisobutyrate dehydrogenase-like beta-hydroxyacid dehydrogenase